ncbi:MAG: hypothetical protein IJK89_03920 [Clostridia bacterium]|nr:hypothetical protein [Clostridia bacterium]
MTVFDPEENTAICMYGPPEYFESPTDGGLTSAETEKESFFGKIISAIKKLIDFLKGLFKQN